MKIGVQIRLGHLNNFAHQRIPIGVRTRGRQPQHHITRHDFFTVDDLGFFDSTHRKAGQIIFAIRVHARHLGGLTPNQGATGHFTTGRNPFDHIGRGRDIEFAASEVVEKKQRFSTLHQNIVDAHGDEINAHGVVFIEMKR